MATRTGHINDLAVIAAARYGTTRSRDAGAELTRLREQRVQSLLDGT